MPAVGEGGSATGDRLTLGSLLKSLAAAGGFAVAVIGWLEYREAQDVARAGHTMEQIAYWEQGGAREAYRALSGSVARVVEKIPPDQLAKANLPDTDDAAEQKRRDEFRTNLRRNIVARVYAGNDATQHRIDEVVYFFSRLGLCIEAKLCDPCSANVFFGDTLGSFLGIFRETIDAHSRLVPGYGAAVFTLEERLATAVPRGMDSCQERRTARENREEPDR